MLHENATRRDLLGKLRSMTTSVLELSELSCEEVAPSLVGVAGAAAPRDLNSSPPMKHKEEKHPIQCFRMHFKCSCKNCFQQYNCLLT